MSSLMPNDSTRSRRRESPSTDHFSSRRTEGSRLQMLLTPFVTMLLAIALLPLAVPRFWESNARKLVVSALLGLPVLVLYARYDPSALVHTGHDYVSFIVLLGSLFVVSGGILVTGDLEAS